jgi:hypothetical protein
MAVSLPSYSISTCRDAMGFQPFMESKSCRSQVSFLKTLAMPGSRSFKIRLSPFLGLFQGLWYEVRILLDGLFR